MNADSAKRTRCLLMALALARRFGVVEYMIRRCLSTSVKYKIHRKVNFCQIFRANGFRLWHTTFIRVWLMHRVRWFYR